MRWKDSCKFEDMSTQLLFALIRVETFYESLKVVMWVTSVNDSQHMEGSKHGTGDAADLRTSNLKPYVADLQVLADQISTALGPEYDFIFEGDHFHLEYDPK